MKTNSKSWLAKTVLIIAALTATILIPGAARAAGPWYVAPTGNDSNSCLSAGSPCATINGAIGNAISGDTIYVATGTYTNSSDSEVVLIDKDITLSGGWDATFTTQSGISTIDGQGARRGVFVNSDISAIIEHFLIQNGYHDGMGGGIYNDGSFLALNDSLIFGNTGANAAGIANYSGNLTINNSQINNNVTDYGVGGGIYSYDGYLEINNSTVSNNSATGIDSEGGGIFNYSAVVLIKNSTISNNFATKYGGISTINGVLSMENSTISGNVTLEDGGGIYNNLSGVNLYNVTIINNTADSDNNGTGDGGGIMNFPTDYSTTYFMNTILAGNVDKGGQAPDCAGEALTSGGYNLIQNITGCTIDGDTTGNLMDVDPLLGPLQDNGGPTFTHALLGGSPADDAGNPVGCTDHDGNPLTTDQRGVARPHGVRCDIGAFESEIEMIIWYVSPSPDGDDNNDCQSPTSTCATINGAIGKATSGDTILVSIGTYTGSDDQVVLIEKNITLSGGWNSAFTTRSGVSTIDGQILRRGMTVNNSVTVSIERFLVQNGSIGSPQYYGGGIYVDVGANLSVINSSIRRNTSVDSGGGIYNGGTLTVTNSVVSDNTSGEGGGIYNANYGGMLTLINSTFSGNAAEYDGGGISNRGTSTLNYSIISNNTSQSGDGGGIYNEGTATLLETTITGNAASYGGGIYTVGYSHGKLTLSDSTVGNNYASGGGGIYNGTYGDVLLNNSTIIRNIAFGGGGGGNGGGGIYNSSTLAINNSTISGNINQSIGYGGGGIYSVIIGEGSLNINSSTITNNTSQGGNGGGIYIYYNGTAKLKNSILAGNTDNGSGPDCYGTGTLSSISSLGYNLIGDTSGCTITSASGDLFNAEANLGKLVGFPGYHPLLSGSPAINTGNPAGCTDNLGNPLNTDQRGAERVGRCDMGAYEYTVPGPASSVMVLGGTPQTTPPLLAFRNPLQAVVLDGIGTPINAVTVIFSAPESGASGTFADSGTYTTTAMTNTSGVADAVTFTANNMLGSYQVTATVDGVITPANFFLTNIAWYVSTIGNDNHDCQTPATTCASINGALSKSGFVDSDTVEVMSGNYTSNTDNEVVLLNKSVTLSGGWNASFSTQSGETTIDGGGTRGGITVNKFVTAFIDHFTIQNGSVCYSCGGGGGGGISNSGFLTLDNSKVSNNTAANVGGGIGNHSGNLTLNNSTVSGNTSLGNGGGGIFSNGILTLNNSTVSGNTATGTGSRNGGGIWSNCVAASLNSSTVSYNTAYSGGGIYNSCTLSMQSSIVAGNTSSSGDGPDCYGTLISSAGYNLIGNTTGCTFNSATGNLINVDARLFPVLVGVPGIHPLNPNSPAINAGNPAGCTDNLGNPLTTDQRGVPRLGRCDIGAYEYDPVFDPITYNFLPLIRKPRLGISGQVSLNSNPIAGVSLELRFFDGSSFSTLASTVTDVDGGYEFTGIPSLGAGQTYYVIYRNDAGTPGQLWFWGTRELTSYTTGSSVAIGDFDIADIALIAPTGAATVALPYTFEWTPRPATPSDVYEFDLYDPYDLDTYIYPVVGYVGSYTLNSLPAGFIVGKLYTWEIWVYSPDGGFGISYETRAVYFSNKGSSVTTGAQPVRPKSRLDWEERRKK